MNNSSSTGSSRPVSAGSTSGVSSNTSSTSGFGSATGSSSGLNSSDSASMSSGSGLATGQSKSAGMSASSLPSMESFMTPTVKNLALGILIPAVLSRIRLRWIAYGAIAYFGLRLLKDQGVLPQQADQAFDKIDRGIDAAKEKMGIGKSTTSASIH